MAKDKKPKKDKERSDSGDYGKFQATTVKELRQIAKQARRREKEKKEAKGRPKNMEREEPRTKIEGVNRKRFLRIYKKIMNAKLEAYKERVAADKKRKETLWMPSIPRYDVSQPEKLADSNFVYAVQNTLAHLSWKELKRLTKAALGEVDEKIGLTYTATFKAVEQIMHQTLKAKCTEDGVRYRLADRDDTLRRWPAKVTGEEEMSKKEAKAAKEGKKSKKASREAEGEEEEAPRKSKKDKGDKAGKAEKSSKKEKGEKKAKPAKLSDDSLVSKLKERERGGPKTKLLNLLSRKGMPFKKLRSKAKEEGLPVDKIGAWLTVMAKNGFVGIE
jgi:hypothetical protein